MTIEAHDHARSATSVTPPAAPPRSRPRWLIPGLVVVIAGAGLVLTGVISTSTAVSAGLIGGMLLMHLGGHGGHGAHGGTTSAGEPPVDEAGKPAHSDGHH